MGRFERIWVDEEGRGPPHLAEIIVDATNGEFVFVSSLPLMGGALWVVEDGRASRYIYCCAQECDPEHTEISEKFAISLDLDC